MNYRGPLANSYNSHKMASLGYSSSNRNINPQIQPLEKIPINVGRTKSVGTVGGISTPNTTDKKDQAAAFISRLKRDKHDRERQQKAMVDAKDQAFLSKLQQTLNNR